MADQLHNQLEKFLSRSRRRKGLSDTNLTAAKQTIGFRPSKQAKVTPYRPAKRNRKTGY